MRIVPTLAWTLKGAQDEVLDARLLPLLQAIATSASLAAAVGACNISYRTGWGMLRDYQRKFGAPLVLLERGRGASLTAAGKRMVDADIAARRRLSPGFAALAVDIGAGLQAHEHAPAQSLRVAASHDLALAALANALPAGSGLDLEVSFMGSLHALKEFAEGRADVAGFHVPISGSAGWDRRPFLRGLDARRDRLIRFVDREQGLILPPGNPAHARNFRDIAARGLRFINRQRGSGTRLLIDRMIAREKLDPADIIGYGKEEFTHPAVAATVASGGADAGFGLRAAAAEYRLAFAPLVRERYFLAIRGRSVSTAAVSRLIALLRGPVFNQIVRRLPGYRSAAAGSVVGIEAIGSTRQGR